jgi:hypothetical protein
MYSFDLVGGLHKANNVLFNSVCPNSLAILDFLEKMNEN